MKVTPFPHTITELRNLAEQAALRSSCPSISWGLVVDGRLEYHGSIGDMGNGQAPNPRTVYRIASMTKSFTAATVLALRDEGVWTLDDPVARYASELAGVVGPAGSPAITIRQLLSMTAGLVTDDAWADRHLDISADEIDAIYSASPTFARVPNTAYEYSNLGYAMLGRAIARATGKSAQSHISDRLLTPFGMQDTTWVQPAHDDWARPYRVQDGKAIPDRPDPIGDGELAPMGGLWSTVADLAKWVSWLDSANLEGDRGPTVGLSAASRREMQRMHTYIGIVKLARRTSPSGYGFGINIRDDESLGKIVSHAGGLPGYGSNMRWLQGRGVGVIALANASYAPMSELTMQFLSALETHDEIPPRVQVMPSAVWKQAAERLVGLLNNWDDEEATKIFADNVALDESFDRRRAAAESLIATHGTLRVTSLHAMNAAHGVVVLHGTGTPVRMSLRLSPVPDGTIQEYDFN